MAPWLLEAYHFFVHFLDWIRRKRETWQIPPAIYIYLMKYIKLLVYSYVKTDLHMMSPWIASSTLHYPTLALSAASHTYIHAVYAI